MNTKTVSRILKVSPKTVQRWVKQLNLDLKRNELGHFLFEKDDVEELRLIHQQLQNGVLLQDVKVNKKPRKGTGKQMVGNDTMEKFFVKMEELERKLDQKADSVVSYQLLQHRSEIEELHEQITKLKERIESLEQNQKNLGIPIKPLPVLDQTIMTKRKKNTKIKNLLTMLFTI
ncbi:MerR family transcriptional regulator [Peribacillus alkalitolerans]|uniref:MerR family transcriptional regulator n=1 Tax=Peribacillus alkalitolerans TaxID=1550385 RepID=UPI0013D438A8|nr:MerR family transcriptional regulator [Peribacillus alkalitolerans]